MFLEPHFKGQRSGWIEVICGSMFSGKTEELIRRLKRARIAGQVVHVYKPEIDRRYHDQKVVSHDDNALMSTPIRDSSMLLDVADDVNVVGIDEAQFFDQQLPDRVQDLAMRGIRVIIAGLDMDFRGQPFGPIPDLLAVAEYITKVHAICPHCGNLATHSYRLTTLEETVVLGEKDAYEPRCRTCYHMGPILDLKPVKSQFPEQNSSDQSRLPFNDASESKN
ncbi:MAG: thymidine kinase [Saprospiraceae bacterium]|nr:thymidine kinase [Saprospiraceae bacterium]